MKKKKNPAAYHVNDKLDETGESFSKCYSL